MAKPAQHGFRHLRNIARALVETAIKHPVPSFFLRNRTWKD